VSRDNVLHKIRTALGRGAGQAVPDPPAARIRIPQVSMEARVASMLERVRALAGEAVERTIRARSWRGDCGEDGGGIERAVPRGVRNHGSAGVRSGITDREELRELCAAVDVGITSADYALADTGTLVMLASPQEARMISLLPPAHIAVVPRARILTGLDELFSLLPNPAESTSSMVLITGPSRTADIEQILVRGVHGPGLLSVVVV
jgi:hypothetical protein